MHKFFKVFLISLTFIFQHPVAYFGGDNTTATTAAPFDIHYKWTDLSCLETPFIQFV